MVAGELGGRRARVAIVDAGFGGLCATKAISRFQAIASIGRLRLSGFTAWWLWLTVHLFALTGFENRVAVLVELGDRLPRPRASATRHHYSAGIRSSGFQAQAAVIRSGLGAFDVRRRG